jgi:protein ImuA
MRESASMAGDRLASLRREIAAIEGQPVRFAETDARRAAAAGMDSDSGGNEESAHRRGRALSPSLPFRPRRSGMVLPLGIAPLDSLLAGGLRRNGLHEIRGETMRDAAAATGFAIAVLARLAAENHRPLLWVTEAAVLREAGLPYGTGLDRFGLDATRLIVVSVRRPGEALWVLEEGLRCAGLAGAVAEIRGAPRKLDLTASRRLALRARENGVLGLLLRLAGPAVPGAALTRWLVMPRPAGTLDDFAEGIGRPAWRLVLERNRLGQTGSFDVEWDHGSSRFLAAQPTLSRPGPSLSPDRPHSPPAARPVVALRRAS